ncbi:transducin family protein / WD-40 repeat family protein [Striga asiatica]|uniref:Transducin family protein / WD-40 repeat family protein n=1 Tax=Striga asiatica TaxID=4170 RepID=A0A5A7PRB1_STRAF|nr:transducin family protein / WD-40 repeat family protein [Striga asiatica]
MTVDSIDIEEPRLSLDQIHRAAKAMSLCKDLVYLILQFCNEENLKRTAHVLEQETGYFFDLQYFEELVLKGSWDEVESYLSSFTEAEDNKYSTKIYFEIMKQKYLEALDKHEFAVALDILLKDLKVFERTNKELYKEMTQLLSLDDFREHNLLAFYGDTSSARKRLVNDLRNFIEANPLLQEKTKFPQITKSRLRRLINQSLNWQHIHCANPHPQPHIDTLFIDHKCPESDNLQNQSNKDSSLISVQMVPFALHLTSTSTSNKSSENQSKIITTDVNIVNPSSKQAFGDRTDSCLDASESKSKEYVDNEDKEDSATELPSDFPKNVERIINVGSAPTTMDFNPFHETLLLVGNSIGVIELWDVASAKKLVLQEFVIPGEDIAKNPGISVNRVLWSSDGALFGVAYSKRLVHLYSYRTKDNHFDQHLEIDAHVGGVWDISTGAKQYTFKGHDAPVYSLCPHNKKDVHFLFSVSTSGEIKAWLFDNVGSRLTYDAPGFCCMRMVYSTDGKRLFSCGTNGNGDSYIVEWNEREGSIIRNYCGLSKCSSAMIHFDTSVNQFLAAGDEHLIKIWDMDSAEIRVVIDADGDLPARPYIRFDKKGNFLAVCGNHNQIKILANDIGRELLQNSPSVSGGSDGFLADSFSKLSVNPSPEPLKAVLEEGNSYRGEAPDVWEYYPRPQGPEILPKMAVPNISQVVEVSRCQSVRLTSEIEVNMIRRLMYAHSGNAILALAESGTHLLWRWPKSYANSTGLATTKSAPKLIQPWNGSLMINDIPVSSTNVSTFTWSKNDSYVVSSSGGMVNLYNIFTFKKLRSVSPTPPGPTCVLFYPPDNNVIAIGFDDSRILIFNIRQDKLLSTLQGHSSRISGLAFSSTFNVLVSCAVDTEIVLWDMVKWEKKRSTILQISVGYLASELSETIIQLDKDHNHFLAVHETQLAIYETMTLRRIKQWTIANFCTRISHATSYVGPLVVAAHPQKPSQLAIGLSNGEVVIIEPLGCDEDKWTAPPFARI